MKREMFLVVLGWITAALIQVTFIANIRADESRPNLILCLLVILIFTLEIKETFLWVGVLMSGFVLDLFHGGRLGMTMMYFSVVLFTLNWIKKQYLRKSNILIILVLVCIISICYDLSMSFGVRLDLIAFSVLIGNMLYNVLLSLIILSIINLSGKKLNTGVQYIAREK